MNRLYYKFENRLGKRKIDEVIESFKRIKSIVFLEGNIEDLIESYLYGLCEIISLNERINSLNDDKRRIIKSIEGIKNRSIEKLRYNGELKEWLMKLDDKELSELNFLVDIKKEFNEVDMEKFRIKKSRSNSKVY